MNFRDTVQFDVYDDKAYNKSLITNLAFFGYNTTRTRLNHKTVITYFQSLDSNVNIECFQVDDIFLEGTAQFADSIAATRLLQKETHIVEQLENLFIQPSYTSDHQHANTGWLKTSISDLNAESIKYIFSCLNLGEQINFALTSRYILDIFKKNLTTQYKKLDINTLRNLNACQSLVFLKLFGPLIKTLRVHRDLTIKLFRLLTSYTPDVNFCNCVIGRKYVSRFSSDCAPNILDDILLLIGESCPNLKYLRLYKIYGLIGTHLNVFRNLESLTIHSCHNITQSNYMEIFTKLKNLRYLEIRLPGRLKEIYAEAILENLVKIEWLRLYADSGYFNRLAKLPNLRRIEIGKQHRFNRDYPLKLRVRFFKNLCQYQGKRLIELNLQDYCSMDLKRASLLSGLKALKVLICPNNDYLYNSSMKKISEIPMLEELNVSGGNFTDSGILYLIRHSLKLKHICICKVRLSRYVLPNILRVLKELHASGKRSVPLTVKIDEKTYKRVIKTNPNLTEATNILKIDIHPKDHFTNTYVDNDETESEDEVYDADEVHEDENDDSRNDFEYEIEDMLSYYDDDVHEDENDDSRNDFEYEIEDMLSYYDDDVHEDESDDD